MISIPKFALKLIIARNIFFIYKSIFPCRCKLFFQYYLTEIKLN
jgi:hypothetical protein